MQNTQIKISAAELVDLALSPNSPNIVNFGALRSCLLAMLGENTEKDLFVSPDILHGNNRTFGNTGDILTRLEANEKAVKELKGNSNEIDSLLTRAGLSQNLKTNEFAISDIWKAVELDHRVSANTNGIDKLGRIMDEMSKLMRETERRQKEIDKFMDNMENKVESLGKQLNKQMKELHDSLDNLSDSYIDKSLLQTYVTWSQLEDSLTGLMKNTSLAEVLVQTDQSISKMQSRSVSVCDFGPSEELTELLNKLGNLASDHVGFIKKMNEFEESLKGKANSSDLKYYMPTSQVEERFQLLGAQTSSIEASMDNANQKIISLNKSTQQNCREITDLNEKIEQIIMKCDSCSENIQSIQALCVALDNSKASQCAMDIGLATKADKSQFEDLLSISIFKETVDRIENAISEIYERMTNQEIIIQLREAMRLLAEEVNSKLSSSDFNKFKQFIEKKITNMKRGSLKMQTDQSQSAIINRRLTTSFHCLSCGRPVNVVVHKYLNEDSTIRPTSVASAFREVQTNVTHLNINRPFSAIREIRSKSKDPHKNERNNNWWQSDHNCLLNPYKKPTPVIHSSLSMTEIPLLGRDGHLYKGRINNDDPDSAIKYRANAIASSKNLAPSTPCDSENYTHYITDGVYNQEASTFLSLNNFEPIQTSDERNGKISHDMKSTESPRGQ